MKKIVTTKNIELLDITNLGVELNNAELKKTIELFTYLRERLNHNLNKANVDDIMNTQRTWQLQGALEFITNCLKTLKK